MRARNSSLCSARTGNTSGWCGSRKVGEPAIGPKNGTLRSMAAFITAVDGPPSIEPNSRNTLSCVTSWRAFASACSDLLSSSSTLKTSLRPAHPAAAVGLRDRSFHPCPDSGTVFVLAALQRQGLSDQDLAGSHSVRRLYHVGRQGHEHRHHQPAQQPHSPSFAGHGNTPPLYVAQSVGKSRRAGNKKADAGHRLSWRACSAESVHHHRHLREGCIAFEGVFHLFLRRRVLLPGRDLHLEHLSPRAIKGRPPCPRVCPRSQNRGGGSGGRPGVRPRHPPAHWPGM